MRKELAETQREITEEKIKRIGIIYNQSGKRTRIKTENNGIRGKT